MEIKLNSEQRMRVSTNSSRNFIDVNCGKHEMSLDVSFLTSQQYFEVRKKDGQICSFYFESKGHKKEYEFGYWKDAEIVFSNNEVKHINNK